LAVNAVKKVVKEKDAHIEIDIKRYAKIEKVLILILSKFSRFQEGLLRKAVCWMECFSIRT
jgi:hypothetical protein